MTLTQWEPPMAAGEADHLVGMLERLRATFRWKADGLSKAQLETPLTTSPITVGGLLKHLALCEDFLFTWKLDGSDPRSDWLRDEAVTRENLWDLSWDTSGLSADELYDLWDTTVIRTRGQLATLIANGALDSPAFVSDPDGNHASVRRLVCDLIEEYGRHTGHADLLREAVDGRVGEDPPSDWRPVSGTSVTSP